VTKAVSTLHSLRSVARPVESGADVCAHPGDRDLVANVLGGDAGALEVLIARLRCVPAFLAGRNGQFGRLLSAHELEDLVQDTLIAIWQKLSQYRGDARLESWVCQFSEFHLRNALRKAYARRAVAAGDPDGPAAPGRDSSVDLEAVHLAIQDLDEPEAVVVRLKHFDGLTFDEIAARLACSPNTAKTRYYRALERLRGTLLRRREGPK
jgi:RNA polymerase sigma-70 factor (ECF subfamily)